MPKFYPATVDPAKSRGVTRVFAAILAFGTLYYAIDIPMNHEKKIDTAYTDADGNAMRGDRPAVRIEGDVQFAAEVNWLVEHVRWDAEEDLSRLIGDAPAHTLANLGRSMAEALRNFVSKLPGQDKAPR